MVHWRHRIALGVAIVGATGCAARPTTVPRTVPSASVAIYGALLDHAFPRGLPDTVLLEEQTASYRELPADNWLRRGKEPVPPPLAARLSALSASSHAIVSAAFPVPVRLLSSARARQLATDHLGATSVLVVTPIAFAADSSQALVYYDARCGAICGGGYELWFVQQVSGRWVLRQEVAHWRS